MDWLNRLPIGTIITLTGCIGAVIALITGELDYLEFTAALGASGIAGGSIGVARNGAGHGVE